MPAALDGLGDLVRPAGPGDAVAGVPARYVATPSSTAQVSAVLRAAADDGLTVVVRGGGTRQSWAAPPRRLDLLLDTRRLTGVVEHVAGDLIAVVRAGTTMWDLQAALAPAGQQLALDVPADTATPDGTPVGAPGGAGAATVGGTVAVAASGPRRMLYGTVRDLLIGVTAVRADGVVAHAGGKVVKNVAGYDLGKLLSGSYGTLAVITRCAFRLHPVPVAESVVARRVPDAGQAGRLVAAVLGAQVVPSAVEVDAPPGAGVEVAVAVEGVPAGVRDRVARLQALLGGDAAPRRPDWWGAYPWVGGGTGLKLTAALSRVPDLLVAARSAADRHGAPLRVRGSAGTGVLYAGAPADTAPEAVARIVDDLRTAAADAGGHAVVVTAPAAVRDRVDLWGPVDGLALMRRVKQRFDPDGRLAPGRFVGGI